LLSWYTVLLSIHVLAATVWIGSAFMSQVLVTRARRADGPQLAILAREIDWYGMRFLVGASLVLILTGFGLVAEGSWDLGQTWLVLALIAWVASFVTGAGFLGPTSKKVGLALDASRGEITPEIRSVLDRLFLVSRVELVVLMLVAVDMVMKPGT
jgi:uncharacterized membrane protein